MSSAPSSLGQLLSVAQLGVKGITLPLGALILPIGRPLVRQRLLELLDERLVGAQAPEDLFGAAVPEDAAVLLAGAADAADAAHGHGHGLLEALEDEVQRLHPHGDGGVDLARLLADVDALLNAILGAKVSVKVDLGLSYDLEVRVDNNG